MSFIQEPEEIPEAHKMQDGDYRLSAPPREFVGHGSRQFDIEPCHASPFVSPDRPKHERPEWLHRQADLDAPALTNDIHFAAGDRPDPFDRIDEQPTAGQRQTEQSQPDGRAP